MGTVNRLQSVLAQLESRLQAFFEGGEARLFPDGECAGLAQRLAAAMQAEIHPQPDGTLLAPNLYTLIVHPTQECALPEKAGLLSSLAAILQRGGEDANLCFLSPPVVRVITDPGLSPQEIQILTTFRPEASGDPAAYQMARNPVDATDRLELPSKDRTKIPAAFLIVDGSRTISLPRQGLTIGRQPDLPLVLMNPHVSRVHAQIRLVQERYVIFDLESRGGTYVNGQRVTQCLLHPGDVISLAGTQLVFGQEASGRLDDTQEIHI